MTWHNGSSRMAHNLDRFSHSDFEAVAVAAARFNLDTDTVHMYLDWYGDQPVTVVGKAGMKSMPAFEAEIRAQIHGERIRRYRQLALAIPVPQNHYTYEVRGW